MIISVKFISLFKKTAKAILPSATHQESHFCGGTHLHLPPSILAMKGFAGSPELAMIGQFAMQSFEVKVVGSERSQQLRIPQP